MEYKENNICYLDEINYDDFQIIDDRKNKYHHNFHQLPQIFPENLDTYCPGCYDYMSNYNQNLFNVYDAPIVYKSFLGTPFLNPVNSKFINYVNPLYNHPYYYPHGHGKRPMTSQNTLFTTPVVVRNSSDLFL